MYTILNTNNMVKRKFKIMKPIEPSRPNMTISLNAKSMLYKLLENSLSGGEIEDKYKSSIERLEHEIENFNSLQWEKKIIILNLILKM